MGKAAAKKLINRPEDCVEEALVGLVTAHPSISRLEGLHVAVRSDWAEAKQNQVALISGGGSGHEPAHAGFIGPGMLSAAVLGGVFASPSIASILSAIRAVTGPHGCLLIVKNYTGVGGLNEAILVCESVSQSVNGPRCSSPLLTPNQPKNQPTKKSTNQPTRTVSTSVSPWRRPSTRASRSRW